MKWLITGGCGFIRISITGTDVPVDLITNQDLTSSPKELKNEKSKTKCKKYDG